MELQNSAPYSKTGSRIGRAVLWPLVGGDPNYGPFLGTLNITCRIIIGIQKGPIILTSTHVLFRRAHRNTCIVNPEPFLISDSRLRAWRFQGFRV